MKKNVVIFTILSLLSLSAFSVLAQKNLQLDDSVEVIDKFDRLFHSGDYYFAGQPNLEALRYLDEQGVVKVINLRSEGENEEFTQDAFNEENVLKELGMEYVSIPMAGRQSYTPETLEAFAEAMKDIDGKVLIHCAGAGRVTYVMMAYLIKYKDYSFDKAVDFGKQVTYFNGLESLLGEELYGKVQQTD